MDRPIAQAGWTRAARIPTLAGTGRHESENEMEGADGGMGSTGGEELGAGVPQTHETPTPESGAGVPRSVA